MTVLVPYKPTASEYQYDPAIEKHCIEVLMAYGYGDRERTTVKVCTFFNATHQDRWPIARPTVSKIVESRLDIDFLIQRRIRVFSIHGYLANSKLVKLQPLEVYRNYRVCHQHFTMDDKSSNMYLKRTAVPSQKLPINAAVLSEMQPNIIGTLSTSTFGSDIRKHDDTQLPSTSFQSFSPSFASESDEVIPIEAVEDQYEKNTSILTQTLPRSGELYFPSIHLIDVVQLSSELTPKAKPLYQRATKLQNVVAVYKKRSLTFKKQLQLAEKNKWSFDSSEMGLQREAVRFCIQQLSRKHSVSANCEETFESSLLQLKDLVLYCTPNPQNNMHNIDDNPSIDRSIASKSDTKLARPLSKAAIG
ncbi:hypothetical protein FQA39_LY13784 [Lamprigera yunnana]|nr:hypothetical protein FQA39_LY13784 [Lamprigera yunnana]